MERELEAQMKDSLAESQALREKFQDDLECMQQDAQRRLVEEKAKWKEHILRAEGEKADAIQQAEFLQEQLITSANEVWIARERIFQLESEAQSIRSSPPQVVERADPAAVAEVMRLRDKVAARDEQARRAQRAAAEAQEAVGRESAINQGFQRDVDNARHRLLTVQGSLAELSEENAGLRRELENERIKTVAGSRRLADAVDRQDNALAEVRRDSAQLREQRDRLAQDSAILGIKLHQLRKKQAARRLLHALYLARHRSLATALRALVVRVTNDIHLKKQTRQQEEHASEVASLEADVQGAETRCRNARRGLDALRDSRETVSRLTVKACWRRHQGMVIAGAAAEEEKPGGDASALVVRWCFWGWARVAQGGCTAVAKKARRVEAEKELAGARELLLAADENARCAEAEHNQHLATAEALAEQIKQRTAELEVARTALGAAKSTASSARGRCIRLGAARVLKVLERNRRDRLAQTFSCWVDAGRVFPVVPSTEEDIASLGPQEGRRVVSETCAGHRQGLAQQQGDALARSRDGFGPPTADSTTDLCALSTTTSGGRGAQGGMHTAGIDEDKGFVVASTEDEGGGAHLDALPSVAASNDRSRDNRRDAHTDGVNDTMASNGNTPAPLDVSSIPSTPVTASHKRPSNQDQRTPRCSSLFVDGYPSPGRRSTTSLSTASSKPAASKSSISGASNPVSGPGGSGWPANPDLPRLVLSLRAAVGEELYAVGERLLRCVEADYRETHGRSYHPVPITPAEREQFRVCLEDAARGRLRRAVLTFLRVQESHRAAAVEKDRGNVEKTRQGRRVRVNGWTCGGGGGGAGGGGCLRGARRKSARNAEEGQDGISSLTTGPLSTTAEKARAARVLRDRLVPLLENAADAWGRHRQPWQNTPRAVGRRAATESDKSRFQRRTTVSTRQKNNPHRLRRGNGDETGLSSPGRGRLCCLDSGAGPRKFWEAVAGPRLVEASWNVDIKALEQQLWDLAMLVRGPDLRRPSRASPTVGAKPMRASSKDPRCTRLRGAAVVHADSTDLGRHRQR
ncbi:hypothetical protein Esi_0002_0169 [Ectocarpus siliculosus]|uniref:Uncharacterized protein n=1 Tax=Ectocarpus siliculosus TaxID=2880 RepID=D7FQ57_ECTSI|nr:hypothetical protein Esi_0002_0169 [Ectocarpus siliculosus]|eukprot:CBJ48389.1 hypothetical protein Esi_0002_0169 [Ectocarpus siliculosus]